MLNLVYFWVFQIYTVSSHTNRSPTGLKIHSPEGEKIQRKPLPFYEKYRVSLGRCKQIKNNSSLLQDYLIPNVATAVRIVRSYCSVPAKDPAGQWLLKRSDRLRTTMASESHQNQINPVFLRKTEFFCQKNRVFLKNSVFLVKNSVFQKN